MQICSLYPMNFDHCARAGGGIVPIIAQRSPTRVGGSSTT
jgi:hypothetical protein